MALIARPDTFTAHLDVMPVSKSVLRVRGKVDGGPAALREAKPPGFNPSILILEVVPGEAGAGDVEYVKENSPAYTDVTIKGAGEEFTIKVKTTH